MMIYRGYTIECINAQYLAVSCEDGKQLGKFDSEEAAMTAIDGAMKQKREAKNAK